MRRLLQTEIEWFGKQIGRCNSPIEQRFLTALLFLTDRHFEPADRRPTIAVDVEAGLELMVQVPVDNFRIDFVLTNRHGRNFAIEIDGFTYHGSTPEQFTYDSARQRVITEHGYVVLRFSGQEVTRDALRVANEALRPVLDDKNDGSVFPRKVRRLSRKSREDLEYCVKAYGEYAERSMAEHNEMFRDNEEERVRIGKKYEYWDDVILEKLRELARM